MTLTCWELERRHQGARRRLRRIKYEDTQKNATKRIRATTRLAMAPELRFDVLEGVDENAAVGLDAGPLEVAEAPGDVSSLVWLVLVKRPG